MQDMPITKLSLPKAKRSSPKPAGASQPFARPNNSGIHPTEFNVLIVPDKVDEFITTSSGIKFLKPVDTVDKEQMAAVSGTLIAVSPLAFGYERWPDGSSPPKVGQRVVYAKYSGMRFQGKDNVTYILMKDKDIAAGLDY